MSTRRVSFFKRLLEVKDEIGQKRDAEAGRAWLKVKVFAEGGEYSTFKKADDFVKMLLLGYKDDYIARSLGISEVTVRVHKRNLSATLYDLFGDDFFDMLLDYRRCKKDVDMRITIAENSILSLFDFVSDDVIAGVSLAVKEGERFEGISLDDCSKEVSFLVRHSKKKVKEELKSLDFSKLSYLVSLLSKPSRDTAGERQRLIESLSGGDLDDRG